MLYVIATPIGNLADLTFRALETLKSVDMVLCEDTRVTKKLLEHYEVSVPTMSYHANSTIQKHDKILDLLREGKSLALVSDAGTPTISDPGVMLVGIIKQELPDVKIIPIPGASALTAALSVSGIPSPQFTFYGFLPHKKGRETIFKEIAESSRTSVFYESPHRIEKTLESLVGRLSSDKKVVIARELTKMFEEVTTGNALEVLEYFKSNPDKIRGEFVVIIS
ncbi:MAG: 16S rRNA (cytidine(1402)-2'-O)-methyltransferase [Bacteroidetes bacterium]|nr:16S rRNA (cytidine(1402)-2'-O)-methyltransferase [Bacteroidota bacterium]